VAEATQQSGQSSSQSTSQSQSGGAQQQGNGSGTTQAQTQQTNAQQTNGQQQTQAPQRPAYVPEAHWDSSAGKVKDTFAAHVNELTAFHAAQQSKLLALPQKPEDYKIELPGDFRPPEGVQFQLKTDDPLMAQARTLAKELGVTQEGFSKLLGLYAGAQVATQQQVLAARNAEIAKLGTTGPARIDALTTFYKAQLGDADGAAFMARIFTAADVQRAEKLLAKLSGTTSFTGSGREPPQPQGRLTDEQYRALSPAAKLDYNRQFDQSKMPENPYDKARAA
jgi:hypothetical protein